MEGQPRIEELLTKISFLRKALEFYADDKNYDPKLGSSAKILVDSGHQARFALEQSKEIEEFNQNLIKQLNEAIGDQPIIGEKEQEKLNKINKIISEYGN